MRTTTSRHCPAPLHSHSGDGCHSLETSWVPDHLVQGVDDLCKTGPAIAILLPTVQHELVQGSWAVHRRRQPVILLNGIDDLYRYKRIAVTRKCPTSYSLEYQCKISEIRTNASSVTGTLFSTTVNDAEIEHGPEL